MFKFAVRVRFGQYRASRRRYNISYKDKIEVLVIENEKISFHGWRLIWYNEVDFTSKNEKYIIILGYSFLFYFKCYIIYLLFFFYVDVIGHIIFY